MTTPMDHDLHQTRIAAVAAAVPPYSLTQEEALSHARKRYGDVLSRRSNSILEKVFAHPSIKKRHFAFDDPSRLFDENPDKRIERFTERAGGLSCAAAADALKAAGLSAADIGALVVNTCTGYVCPGLSTYLVERMGLRRDLQAFDLVGAGCGGAVPNLALARSLLSGMKNGAVLSVAVEICSATFQMGNDISLLVSNALFGDGAAAAVVWKESRGLRMIDWSSVYIPEYREDIRFIYKDGQLHNQLSLRLPELAGKAVKELVERLLARNSLSAGQVSQWALHPGGENVINCVQKQLCLSDEQLATTRSVLSEYGNMSSPTSLFALKRLIDNGIQPGDHCILAAFGAGFSAHALLLRAE